MGFVYLSDKTEEKNGLFPGEGTMPLESLLIKMQDTGYTGHFALTVEPEALGAWENENDIISRMEQSRIFLSKYFS